MKNLTVKSKMILLAVLAASSMLLLAGFNYWSNNYQHQLEEMATLLDHIKIDMLTLRKHEKDFLSRSDEKYAQKFEDEMATLVTAMDSLLRSLEESDIDASNLEEAKKLVGDYHRLFRGVVENNVKVGLNDEKGLRGQFREATHKAEAILKEQKSKELLINSLTLRRREKDFLLRFEWTYVEAMEKDYATLMAGIEKDTNLNAATKQELRQYYKIYHDEFIALAKLYKEVGLTDEEGLKGALRNSIHQMEAKLDETETQIDEAVNSKRDMLSQVFLFLTLGLVAVMITLMLWLTRSIMNMIQDLLGELSTATEQVTEAAQQISRGAQDLSQGSIEQAASLEEISSTMEQISGQAKGNATAVERTSMASKQMSGLVEQSSHNAKDASALSQKATKSAASGVKAMEQISENMKDMIDTSNKITDIIQVINDITHQTKMLATNAAIEAARAGDQGKGFSVVADEVSKLAEHSKVSAKEIANLIKGSVEKSKQGAEYVNSGNVVLREINENSTKLSNLISEITEFAVQQGQAMKEVDNQIENIRVASKEQALGLDQINGTIVQLDQVTQNSAANAEESAAAAEELNSQSEALKDLVNRISERFGLNQNKPASSKINLFKKKAVEENSPLLGYEPTPVPDSQWAQKKPLAKEKIPLRDEFKDF